MRALLQRVASASVSAEGEELGRAGAGFLIFWGATHADTPAQAEKLAAKIARLRVFPDEAGKMNLNLVDFGGEALVVSQFTLYADTARGNRPAFTQAAPPALAIPLYEAFKAALAREIGKPVASGRFGADMRVSLVNDGPVTILLEA